MLHVLALLAATSVEPMVSTDAPAVAPGTLTVHPAPDIIVDAAYVKERLQSPRSRCSTCGRRWSGTTGTYRARR